MDRRKAMWAASAVAVTMVAASVAYAATNLLTTTPNDHVGQLQATVERPVQYVLDEVPAPAVPAVVATSEDAPPMGAAVTEASAEGEADEAPAATTTTTSAAPDNVSPSTTRGDDRVGHDDHSTSEHDHQREPEPDDD